MKIKSIRIENFRSFCDETIPFNDYTCLVGPNGCGKSTVFSALNVFFRETKHSPVDLTELDAEDFHKKNTGSPATITVTFNELTEAAQKDFADYYRQGELVVSAVATFDHTGGKARVKQFGQRLGMTDFAPFFKLLGDGAKLPDLKEIYFSIRKQFPDLPTAGPKDAMATALRDYEATHPELCALLPSEDQFYGVSKGANRLGKYLQWVFVPAIKDAASEQVEAKDTALGKLLARTVRAHANFDESVVALRAKLQSEYQDLLDKNQHVLETVSASLRARLAEWSHPDTSLKLEWQQDPAKSVRIEEPFAGILAGEGEFEGKLTRFGHGLQRSYLLALLQELASLSDADAPRMVLAVEEPELFQHPPQARHLASVLSALSRTNSQIMVCTHHPMFVSGRGFEDVRMIRKCPAQASRTTFACVADINKTVADALGEPPVKPAGMLAKIHQSLQPSLNEMFFASAVVFVEGLEDAAYLASYLNLMEKWEEFRRLGCHVVPVGGKSFMIEPMAIAKKLKIPSYLIFDADGDTKDTDGRRKKHERDNRALLKLVAANANDCFPQNVLWGPGFTVWPLNMREAVKNDIGTTDWQEFCAMADAEHGHIKGLAKNTLHIATSLDVAWQAGKRSSSLQTLCEKILDPANRVAA